MLQKLPRVIPSSQHVSEACQLMPSKPADQQGGLPVQLSLANGAGSGPQHGPDRGFALVLLSAASQLGMLPYQVYMLLMGEPSSPCRCKPLVLRVCSLACAAVSCCTSRLTSGVLTEQQDPNAFCCMSSMHDHARCHAWP